VSGIRCLVLTVGLLSPVVAVAQRTGAISGNIRANDSIAVPRVALMIDGTRFSAFSDTNGDFQFTGVPAGRYALRARMIGYAPRMIEVDVMATLTTRVRFSLDPLDPLSLDPVDVRARIPHALRAFEERRSQGVGQFLQYDDIARWQPRQVTDVLRRVPGLAMRPMSGPYGTNPTIVHRGASCGVMYYLNGAPFPIRDLPINNFVSAEELVAVEVYAPSELPPQFNSSASSSRCGLVGLWTRAGHLPPRKR
jgi:hypothetical protein